MSTEPTKAAIRRIPVEVFNQGNLDLVDELFSPAYIEHALLPPDWPPGVPGLKQFVAALRSAFPDFLYSIEQLITEGDTVVVHVTAQGTHLGPFLGVAPTGRRATWEEIHIYQLAAGQVVEHWVIQDQLGLLQQLGAMPLLGETVQAAGA
jgi:predicted ester cyclase